MFKNFEFVLGSKSKERQKLLKKILKFEVFYNNSKIRTSNKFSARAITKELAYFKALLVCLKKPKKIVIAADTLVQSSNKIFGKPSNLIQAKKFLNQLSGKKFYVFSSVCLAYFNGSYKPYTLVYNTKAAIKLKKLDKKSINFYLSKIDWKNKAGAIDISSKIFQKFLVVRLSESDIQTIKGLNLSALLKNLKIFIKRLKKLKKHTKIKKHTKRQAVDTM